MQTILSILDTLPPQWIVVVIAMLPVLELRGAIPVGFMLGMGPWESILWATLGNLLSIPPVLIGLYAARRWARDWPIIRPILDMVERRAEKRRTQVDRYGPWGLFLFVGVPLPLTGSWTGAAIATVVRLPWLPATLALMAGVVLAGAIVGVLTTLGWKIVG